MILGKQIFFTLGIVALEMIGLSHDKIEKLKINWDNYVETIFKCEKKCCSHILNNVSKMLKHDPNERISFSDLLNQLSFLLKVEPDDSKMIEILMDKFSNLSERSQLEQYVEIYCKLNQYQMSLNYAKKAKEIINKCKKEGRSIISNSNEQEEHKILEEERIWFYWFGKIYIGIGEVVKHWKAINNF